MFMTFYDFEKVINARGQVLKINISDFKDYEGILSKARDPNYPKLEEVVVAEFRSGSMSSNEFKSGNFLQKKVTNKRKMVRRRRISSINFVL